MKNKEEIFARLFMLSVIETALLGVATVYLSGNAVAYLGLLLIIIFNSVLVFFPLIKTTNDNYEVKAILTELLGNDSVFIKSLFYEKSVSRWVLIFDEEKCSTRPKSFTSFELMIDYFTYENWKNEGPLVEE